MHIKTKHVTVVADATICIWFLGQIYSTDENKSRTCTVASAPAEIQIIFATIIKPPHGFTHSV